MDNGISRVNEYYAIKNLSGLAYKLYNVIKILTKDGNADEDGFISLSYGKIRTKLGNNNNIVRIVDELENHPELVIVVRGTVNRPNKFKIANSELLK